jgi:peptidyl-tRNA hydrolase
VVQSTHSIADFAYEHPETFGKWKEESNSIICLSAKSQEHLLKLHEKFSRLTPATIFFEPDVDEYTSLCLYGTPGVRKALSHLPLTLKPKNNEPVVD